MRLRPADRPHPAGTRRPGFAAGIGACLLAAAGVAVATAAAPASPSPSAPARIAAQSGSPVATVIVHDPVDTAGGLDLTRVQLGRSRDGRLRAALTLAAPWRMRDLPATQGPPGSLCLRMWTATKGEAAAPDRLLCITADSGAKHMRGSIFVDRRGTLVRVARATLARSSVRTVVARFSQSAIGRPTSVRFAAEATPPGCARLACIDTAPNAPAVATLPLRST
jgi:hypothetical protein